MKNISIDLPTHRRDCLRVQVEISEPVCYDGAKNCINILVVIACIHARYVNCIVSIRKKVENYLKNFHVDSVCKVEEFSYPLARFVPK